MELRLKTISKAGIPEAMAKVELYRFLNEPEEAESICCDVLEAEPDHQLALRQLGLAITDQFTGEHSDRCAEVEDVFQRLSDPYERLYYLGILYERRGKAQLRLGRPPYSLLALFEKAMHYFEEAEKIRPAGNDDAILRWNRCARLLRSYSQSEWHHEARVYDAGDDKPF